MFSTLDKWVARDMFNMRNQSRKDKSTIGHLRK